MYETITGSLYDYPRYYDLVFGSDWRAEFHFLQQVFEKHGRKGTNRLFEPACGTGRLMFRLGKAGFDVHGLDLNSKAVAYCNQRLKRSSVTGEAVVGDMSDFKLAKKVDAAFNTINSFRHLTTQKAAESHLQHVHAALKPGGIYVLGLHLTPSVGAPMEEESWSARRGHLQVNTHLKTIERLPKKRRERFRMTVDVHTPSKTFRIEEEIAFRTYSAKQFEKLLQNAGGWQTVAAYDFAYNLKAPIEIDAATEDVVYILKRQ